MDLGGLRLASTCKCTCCTVSVSGVLANVIISGAVGGVKEINVLVVIATEQLLPVVGVDQTCDVSPAHLVAWRQLDGGGRGREVGGEGVR